jgi:hypothetical protein
MKLSTGIAIEFVKKCLYVSRQFPITDCVAADYWNEYCHDLIDMVMNIENQNDIFLVKTHIEKLDDITARIIGKSEYHKSDYFLTKHRIEKAAFNLEMAIKIVFGDGGIENALGMLQRICTTVEEEEGREKH